MAAKKQPKKPAGAKKPASKKNRMQEVVRRPDGTFAPGHSGNPAALFKPGQSGNPAGQRPGPSLTTRLKLLLTEPVDPNDREGVTRGERLMELAIKAAEDGDYRFFKEILDRVEGKVPDQQFIYEQKREEIVISISGELRQALLLETNDDQELTERVLRRLLGGNAGVER